MRRDLLGWLSTSHPADKMAFLAGPRQVGKTTLAKSTLEAWADEGMYLNWDVFGDRGRILSHEDLLADLRRGGTRPLLVLDELHKMRKFKAWLKGFYDANREDCAIWITGSARLDLYQRGGDSLVGRYFLYRMHPLSVGEIESPGRPIPDPDAAWSGFEDAVVSPAIDIGPLLAFGGFPEPFSKQSSSFHRRWLRLRREQVTHEEVRDLTRIADLDRVEHLVTLLNPRVGAPLSVNSLREDLEVAFETVRDWMAVLERLYYVYGIRPYARRVQRSLRKERKFYYWDWSEAVDEGARFENFVLSHLRKACHVWTDFGVAEFDVWYLRDKEKREVDALLTRDGKPWLALEVKLREEEVAPALVRHGDALDCPRLVQLVAPPGIRRRVKVGRGIVHVASAGEFLRWLP